MKILEALRRLWKWLVELDEHTALRDVTGSLPR